LRAARRAATFSLVESFFFRFAMALSLSTPSAAARQRRTRAPYPPDGPRRRPSSADPYPQPSAHLSARSWNPFRCSEATSLLRSNTEAASNRHGGFERSEEHTSELQSRFDLVCRLLLEK